MVDEGLEMDATVVHILRPGVQSAARGVSDPYLCGLPNRPRAGIEDYWVYSSEGCAACRECVRVFAAINGEDMNTVCTFDDLIHCPLCGAGNVQLVSPENTTWWVECDTCHLETAAVSTRAQAVAAWNSRHEILPRPMAAMARLGAMLCRHLSPTGGFCHTRYEELDKIGIESGVLMAPNLDSSGPILAPGMREMIGDLLAGRLGGTK